MLLNQRFAFDSKREFGRNAGELNDVQLRLVAPSIFAEGAWEKMSERYLMVPTIHVINQMRDEGFYPVRAAQSRSRIPGKQDFTKHMVVFRRSGVLTQVGGSIPEIVLLNSHDGSSGYQVHGGMYRLVCLNGLMVADATIGAVKCRHAKKDFHDIIEGTHTIMDLMPRVADQIELFQSLKLKQDQMMYFAEAANMLRYAPDEHQPIEPVQLLNYRRQADKEPTLWNTFNRIEENMIRGGLAARTSTNKHTKTRKITGVSENVRLEKALWHLTEHMSKLVK